MICFETHDKAYFKRKGSELIKKDMPNIAGNSSIRVNGEST